MSIKTVIEKSYEAMGRLVGHQAQEFARRMGLHKRRIYQLTQPSGEDTDSGTPNPLDRIETMIEIALTLDRDKKDAFAPILYLCRRFGLVVTWPQQNPHNRSLIAEHAETVKEVSEMMLAYGEAMGNDGEIDDKEKRRIAKEAWEALEQITSFIHTLEDQ